MIDPETTMRNLEGVEGAGTHSHTNDTNWQTVVTITTGLRHKVHAIWMNFVNLTQNTNMRLSYDVNGAGAAIFWEDYWTYGADNNGIYIDVPRGIANELTLEIQSWVAEGAARDVDYEVIYERMEG